MALDETTFIGLVATIVSGVLMTLEKIGRWLVKSIRGNTQAHRDIAEMEIEAHQEDVKRQEDQRKEDRLFRALDDLGSKMDRQGARIEETRESVPRLEVKTENLEGWAQNITEDVRTIKRRSTGEVGKDT